MVFDMYNVNQDKYQPQIHTETFVSNFVDKRSCWPYKNSSHLFTVVASRFPFRGKTDETSDSSETLEEDEDGDLIVSRSRSQQFTDVIYIGDYKIQCF